MKRLNRRIVVLGMLLLLLCYPIPVQAAALSLQEICQEFEEAIQNGENQAVFTANSAYTLDQILKQLEKAAEAQQLLYTGDYTCQKQIFGDQTHYTIGFTEDSFVKVDRKSVV